MQTSLFPKHQAGSCSILGKEARTHFLKRQCAQWLGVSGLGPEVNFLDV